MINYKLILVAGVFILLLTIERIYPLVVARFGHRRLVSNTGLWLINAILSWCLLLPITAWVSSHALPVFSVELSLFSVLCHLLVLDAWIYFWHRANHRIPFFWRFHQVHHLDETLDVTSAVRFHFGEVVLSVMFRGVLVWLLAIPFVTVVIFESLVLILSLFQHANIRIPKVIENRLSLFFVTPAIHWVHHHAIRSDTDSNYATILSIWDRIFSTRSEYQRNSEMNIGIGGKHDINFHRLLVLPFSKSNS